MDVAFLWGRDCGLPGHWQNGLIKKDVCLYLFTFLGLLVSLSALREKGLVHETNGIYEAAISLPTFSQ